MQRSHSNDHLRETLRACISLFIHVWYSLSSDQKPSLGVLVLLLSWEMVSWEKANHILWASYKPLVLLRFCCFFLLLYSNALFLAYLSLGESGRIPDYHWSVWRKRGLWERFRLFFLPVCLIGALTIGVSNFFLLLSSCVYTHRCPFGLPPPHRNRWGILVDPTKLYLVPGLNLSLNTWFLLDT